MACYRDARLPFSRQMTATFAPCKLAAMEQVVSSFGKDCARSARITALFLHCLNFLIFLLFLLHFSFLFLFNSSLFVPFFLSLFLCLSFHSFSFFLTSFTCFRSSLSFFVYFFHVLLVLLSELSNSLLMLVLRIK